MQENRDYKEARKLLAERYGQSYKITTAYVNHVINGQPIRTEDVPTLQKFSILLSSCRNTLKEVDYVNHLENPEGLRKIIDWLPYPHGLKWRELVDTITQKEARDPNLKDITDFVEVRSRMTTFLYSARSKVNRADPAVTSTATGQKGCKFICSGKSVEVTLSVDKQSRKENIEVSLMQQKLLAFAMQQL